MIFSVSIPEVENNDLKQTNQKDKISFMSRAELISFAFDLGFAIIIPLIIFALGGRFLDKKFETSPLFLIIGILISLIFTSVAVYKKTRKFTR